MKRDASKACDWSASGSSWPSESLWTNADGRSVVLLVRCGLGNASTRLIVETRLKSDHSNVGKDSYVKIIEHPWRIADNNITYAFASPSVVKAVPSQSAIGDRCMCTRLVLTWV